MPLLALALLALWLYCLFDAITTPDEEARNLPKLLWVIIIVLVPLAGGVFWLLLGRPVGPRSPASPCPGTRRGRRPPGARTTTPISCATSTGACAMTTEAPCRRVGTDPPDGPRTTGTRTGRRGTTPHRPVTDALPGPSDQPGTSA